LFELFVAALDIGERDENAVHDWKSTDTTAHQ
jgi:hypothetical protein